MTAIALPRPRAAILPWILVAIGLLLAIVNLRAAGGLQVLANYDPDDLQSVRLFHGTLPRLVTAIAAGAILGLCTALMQQGLRNPLAEPGTLGLLSAGRFAVAASLVWLPFAATSFVAPVLIGSGLALALIVFLSLRRGFSPLFLILNGLVLGLFFEALTSILILIRFDDIADLLLWQSGSLVQDNWQIAITLLLCLLVMAAVTIVCRRPLSMLDLDDVTAGSLGMSPMLARLLTVVVAATGAAVVMSQVGGLAFVGLAGTTLAGTGSTMRGGQRIARAALLSSAILLVTDQVVQLAETIIAVPAGTVTALFAAPILLFLLGRIRTQAPSKAPSLLPGAITGGSGRVIALAMILVLAAAVAVGLSVGRVPDGFSLAIGAEWREFLPWRWPRVAAALAAGGMIALAGYLMQRMTGNELASPELTGVSSGAALIMLPVIFLLPPLSRPETMLAAGLGSMLFLGLALRLARRSRYAPEKLLLTGLAVTALSGSLLSVVAFFGDIRLTRLVGWLSGSTYAVTPPDAVSALAVLALALAILPLMQRWLTLLPLGEPVAGSLGVHVRLARLCLILLTAILTGVATVLIGPVTFIGLIVPHLVRLLGLQRPLPHAYGCVLVGAVLMVSADWFGRMIAFPWDVPAGLVASVAGAFAYAIVITRSRR